VTLFSRGARTCLAVFGLTAVLFGAHFFSSSPGRVLSSGFDVLTKLDEHAIQLGSLHQPTVKFWAHAVFDSYPRVETP